ncbi:MAG: UDP-N-acetylmuramyl tripeptide synthetase like [Microgenomates group bacterium LiPW_16]|nr:MAG: UDP-N-acetylmuramyl tripeptide synthetase like [Microgenomates group bacterium LiPW_16]
MKKLVLIWLGKIIALTSRVLNLGAGSTWPGHVAFEVEPRILPSLVNQLGKGVILIAGTNGKTTTTKMISEILRYEDIKILRNESGANLLNGMVSALIQNSDWLGKINASWAIFEVDEATLPQALVEFTPKVVVLLNLFRDQLDRYGEVDQVAEKWQKALQKLPKTTTVILNADDSHVAFLGKNLTAKVIYFGLSDPKLFLGRMEHAVDSVYCPSCGQKLDFAGIYFSHLGIWSCPGCGQKRPSLNLCRWEYPLPGVYNYYNTLAAVLVAKKLGVEEKEIKMALANFKPAFGRQEELKVDDKKISGAFLRIKILLSKNPTGFNESIRTLKDFSGKKKTVMLVLNDRIPDGRDVSWIWDVDFEKIADYADYLIISGDRVYDMALRLRYSDFDENKIQISTDLKEAIESGLAKVRRRETLYILPTYSAMLEVRKILGGKKIL